MSISKEDTIWVDGCYDLCHFGHANSLRQAKLMGKRLVVGVHSSAEIAKNKGPPVFNDKERYDMVRSIKWVDEVVEDAPYVTTLETMDKYNCMYCAHGDDLTMDANGVDTYIHVKNAGRYKEFKRTQGVSTTDIVGRMLMASKPPASEGQDAENLTKAFSENRKDQEPESAKKASPWTGVSKFLQTTQKISLFSEKREQTDSDICVYVAGAFDVFHNGHLAFLEACAKLGTYLVVGLHTDEDVTRYRGYGNPIMNVNERTLSVLACRHVNEVVIGAPYKVDQEMIDHFKIKFVCQGSKTVPAPCPDGSDPYEKAKELGIFKLVDSECDLHTSVIIERIIANRAKFMERNRKKQEKEEKVYEAWQKRREEDGINAI